MLSSVSYLFFATNRQYDGSAWQQLNARVGAAIRSRQRAVMLDVRRIVVNAGRALLGGQRRRRQADDYGPLQIASTQVLTTRRTGCVRRRARVSPR